MSIDDTDVLARLRAGADAVEEYRFDADEVLAGSRSALRRRRSWQAVGACTTAAAVAFSLTLAGPVPIPGVGEVTLPGSEQVRELLGFAKADAAECAVPEPAVRRTPEPGAPASMRPRVTYQVTDARPLSTCFDVRIDDMLPADPGLTPETVTEDGAFWRTSRLGAEEGYVVSYQVLGTTSFAGQSTGDENTMIVGLTALGRRAAWYEIEDAGGDEPPDTPRTIRVAGTATGDIRTIGEAPLLNTGGLVMTDERIAWRHGTTVSIAPTDGSAEPEPLVRNATAVGGDSDEIVVVTPGRDVDGFPTATFTSYGDDGSATPLLTVSTPVEGVSVVDVTDDVLTYAFGGEPAVVTVVPRADGVATPDEDQTIVVQLSNDGVDKLSASGDAITWVSGRVAYLLRDAAPSRAGGPDLVRVGQSGQQERMMVGLAGDRIAWNTGDGSEVMVNVGTLLHPGRPDPDADSAPMEPGAFGRAVPMPAAPVVTVPENAVFATYD